MSFYNMTSNGDVIQSNVILFFVLDNVQKKKQMALLDSWGHSASETGLCCFKINILKIDIFLHEVT